MGKIKQWIVAHKVWSIVIASALVVAISLSIALPLALRHKHKYSEDWTKDASYHWHTCTGEDCDSTSDKAEHTFVEEHNDTQYWLECSVCGYEQEKIDATVNSTTLANAILFKDEAGTDYTNLVAVCDGYNTAGDVNKNVKFTENAYYIYDSNNDGISSPKEKMYVNETDGTKATYSKMDENADWTRVVESHIGFQAYAKSAVFLYGTDGYTFEYNQADSTYVATKNNGGTSSNKYTIKFANGKLVSVVVERIKSSTERVTIQYTWTISYGNATIEIPTVTTAE